MCMIMSRTWHIHAFPGYIDMKTNNSREEYIFFWIYTVRDNRTSICILKPSTELGDTRIYSLLKGTSESCPDISFGIIKRVTLTKSLWDLYCTMNSDQYHILLRMFSSPHSQAQWPIQHWFMLSCTRLQPLQKEINLHWRMRIYNVIDPPPNISQNYWPCNKSCILHIEEEI